MQKHTLAWVALLMLASCSGEQPDDHDVTRDGGADPAGDMRPEADLGPADVAHDAATPSEMGVVPDDGGSPDVSETDLGGPDMQAAGCEFEEDFDGPDGSDWPAPWTVSGGVATADLQGGRGRLQPTLSSYSLARMVAPLPGCVNAEATLTFEFSEATTEGIGLYLRHNGGYLAQTNPTGQGYAAFAEAFRSPVGLGLWREIDGDEQNLPPVEPFAIAAGVVYRLRLQVEQTSANETTLRGRIWADGDPEPAAWTLTRTDSSPALQGTAGDLVLDAWSSRTNGAPAEVFIDDVSVSPL